MNEITQIHLGRSAFTVSVEAHKELRDYLDAIKHQVGKDSADVLEEVELRMAELLTDRGISGDKVVLPADIAYLREQLGEPRDFKDDDETEDHHPEPVEQPRRLFRDTDHAMIAGVASGLAHYFGVDPVIIRILFVAFTLLGGSGILIYLLLWLLVPEAKTTSDRLHMEGKAATVDNLKKLVERADVPGAARRGGNAAAKTFGVLGTIVLLVIGLPLAIGAGFAILGTLALASFFLLDGFKVAGHVVAPIGGHEVLSFIAGTVALLMILLTMLLVGIAMVRRRWQLPAWGMAAIVGIFFLSAAVGGALAADVEPRISQRVRALEHTQIVQLPAFTQASLSGTDTHFTYVPDGKNYVSYHYFGSVNTNKLNATVLNNKLTVRTDGADTDTCNSFCTGVDPGIDVDVHGPKLETFTVNGEINNLSRLCYAHHEFDSGVDCWPPMPKPALPTEN